MYSFPSSSLAPVINQKYPKKAALLQYDVRSGENSFLKIHVYQLNVYNLAVENGKANPTNRINIIMYECTLWPLPGLILNLETPQKDTLGQSESSLCTCPMETASYFQGATKVDFRVQ